MYINPVDFRVHDYIFSITIWKMEEKTWFYEVDGGK